ncbi:serine protease [Coprinopsis cinerea okayama7|uniref:Serine protease n=1 Tax=Coprinopsis cinerea (strain Okayama-7 / 130 / ATCC MYA-4618 / FGSC 9003) TaxID=240176 RepID=A8PF08_COPC7|nr:serine protease [Coprinopsis cinerea okayama7\|eukprot:XP_001840893.2 serine protease [Coprinopsis cinerea okayama7\
MRIPGSHILTFLSFLSVALGTPTIGRRAIERYEGETTDRLIFTLKPGVSKADLFNRLRIRNLDQVVTHQWSHALNGFAAKFSKNDPILDALHSSPEVESISEDGIFSINDLVTQTNATWGLGRLSSVDKVPSFGTGATNYSYIYEDAAGRGTDIYVLGGLWWTRQICSYIWTLSMDMDMGPTSRKTFNSTSLANVLGVKVLNDTGSGTLADIIASLSFGGGATSALDNAVVSLINSGVHVVVAAGNSNTNASNVSPARVPAAITVGAVDITDTKTATSNWGPAVDVFAPGQNIRSAWASNDSATEIASGTSMAAPYVAGLIGYFISFAGNTNPAEMQARVKDWSLVGVLKGLPQGTPNNLVTNSYVCNLVEMMICI